MDERQLGNVWRNRRQTNGGGLGWDNRISMLAEPLTVLMKQRLAKRVRQIGRLSTAWDECIPEFLRDRTALVSFVRGTLTVAVGSAAYRYRLEMLLREGLLDVIRQRFSGALNRVRLVPGEFDAVEMPKQ